MMRHRFNHANNTHCYVITVVKRDAHLSRTVEQYMTDTWDEIKEEHKGVCALLDATEPDDHNNVYIPGVGHASYYPNFSRDSTQFIPPTYTIEVGE
jgi:hypothetical protein